MSSDAYIVGQRYKNIQAKIEIQNERNIYIVPSVA